jgi:hypothetical protein
VVAYVNPFQYVLTRRIIGVKYNKWFVVLQEFYLDFALAKSKKSLVFDELIPNFPQLFEHVIHVDSFIYEHIFLISSWNPWYGYILIYLQTLKFSQDLSRDDRRRIRYQAKNYLLHNFLTRKETKSIHNDYHSGACGGHLSELSTTQNILRAGYFWPSIFKDYVKVEKKFHPY